MRALLLLIAFFFFGCAHKEGVFLDVGNSTADSLRAKFSLELQDADGKWQKLSGVLFSVPEKRYRMELSGPLGIGVASLLWTDSLWTILFPTEKTYLKGRGYMVGLPGSPEFPWVNIHQVASFFEGRSLPKSYEVISSRDSSGIRTSLGMEASGMKFEFVSSGEKILSVRRGNETAFFEWPIIRIERESAPYLKIEIKNVRTDATWGKSVWNLFIPETYTPL